MTENTQDLESEAVALDLPKEQFGLKIDQLMDIPLLQSLVVEMWKIIDSIDTVSDIAKYNDKVYRQMVESLQSKRFEFVTSDGYDLFLNNSVNTSIERFPNKVHVEEVLALQSRRREINEIPLSEIEFFLGTKKLSIDEKTIEDWKFIGLSNVDFVENQLIRGEE